SLLDRHGSGHNLSRAFLNGSNLETIVSARLETPYGLAVDSFGQNIYWTDSSERLIEVASLNGLYRSVLVRENLQSPKDIVLDVTRGFMYWTDWISWNYNSKIEKADMDGGNRTVVVQFGTERIERASLAGVNRTTLVDLSSSSQYWPNAVFEDYTEDRVYWIDSYDDVIDSTDLNGQNRQLLSGDIHPSQNMNPFDFTVYSDTLYWSDWNTDGIERLNWTSADYIGGLVSLKSNQPFGIALIDQSRLPSYAGNQQCKVNNGGCSHLCLLTPDGFSCACPDGLLLLSDGKNCQTDLSKFLLFAEGRSLKQLPLNYSTTPFRIPINKENISSPTALDYNFIDRKVYWTDTDLDTISPARF
ncbi:low-density lipoprotein receptor-related protein 4-like, partial [Orbicella faveolata]|uniref:low-density lipoprotein receptor-related protein 4-like n=1 Tax=Orbicella faveolata TaxID=48498 RepID=UPI0009E3E08D